MFKTAYVRGIQSALIQSGHAVFPDGDRAMKVAAYVADNTDFDPMKPSRETATKVAKAIVQASLWFKNQPGFKAASFDKVASEADLDKLAEAHVVDLMTKAAEGSTIEGGDKGNQEPSSGEAKMDTGQRPSGYAEHSQGKTDVDTRPGAVGKEQEQPNKPAESPGGSNSVTEQTHTAALADLIKRATGSTIMGGDKGNTTVATGEGKMDLAQRPHGYAENSQGTSAVDTRPGAVGKEMPQPNKPAESPSGTNSIIAQTRTAGEDPEFIERFQKVARAVVPHFPGNFNEDQKVAHVRACMSMSQGEQALYLAGLQKEAADGGVPAVPPGSRTDGYRQHTPEATHARPGAYDGRGANQGTKQGEDGGLPPFMKKDDDKKDEKKDDDKDDKKDGLPDFLRDKIHGDKKDDDKKDEKKDDEKDAALQANVRRIFDGLTRAR